MPPANTPIPSPNPSIPTLDYAPSEELDVGRFVARYLQVWAGVSILAMVLGPVLADSLHLDLSPIFLLWAASALNRRSEAARLWVVLIGRIALFAGALMMIALMTLGTASVTLMLGGYTITDAPRWLVLILCIPALAIVAVPLFMLESDRAKQQFARPRDPRNDPAAVAERLRNVR